MNREIKTGLVLNASGVVLFLLWLLIQGALPLAFSLTLALVFCSLLGASLFYLLKGARHAPREDTQTPQNPSDT
jgi:hypothetical protein